MLQTSRGWQSLGARTAEAAPEVPGDRNDVSSAKTLWSAAHSSHTEWTFWSHHADPNKPSAQLPFVSLAYHVTTDLHGRLKAGQRVPLRFDAYQVPGAVDAGRVSGAG